MSAFVEAPSTTEEDHVDPQLMADFEEFMAHKMQTKCLKKGPTATPRGHIRESLAPTELGVKSKKAINCEKARAKRTEYAALKKEVEFLRELVKQRNLTETHTAESHGAPLRRQNARPDADSHHQTIIERPRIDLNFD